MDSVGPALAGLVFIAAMSRVPEPKRLRINAVLVIGVSSAYLSGGFGPWELVYPAVMSFIGYRAMFSYRFIGIGWLLHSAWDVAHHLWASPLWPFMATSSWGCMIFDAVIGLWFVSGVGLRLPHLSPTRQNVRA